MYAVLHLPDFPLQAVARHERDLAGQPAALFSGNGKKSQVLVASVAARAAGVEPGMTAPQAVARCPALQIRAPRPSAEAEARAALLAVGFTLSPTIEDTAPGLCTADLRALTAPAEPLAAAAIAQLAALGLAACAGIAATPLLARYAAQSETDRVGGVRVVRDAASFLAPLPLPIASPSPELAAILAGWGLRTLGDLTALPRDEIVRRFGGEGLALWQRAAGGAPRPLHPVALPREFRAAMEFEDEIETLEPLLFILRRFLDRLTLELRASQHVAAGIELTLQLADDHHHQRDFRLPEPTADVEILFRALYTHLESLHTEAAIAAAGLRLIPARPLVRQHGLFDTGLRDPHGFAETLARVSALAGADRVGAPQIPDTHRPDAVQLAPPAAVVLPPADPPLHAPLGLPLRRYRPPLPVKLEFAAGAPAYLWTEYFEGAVACVRGPWPSSGDWWEPGRRWQRTEWDLALEGGGLYRLTLSGEAYFVEGEYD